MYDIIDLVPSVGPQKNTAAEARAWRVAYGPSDGFPKVSGRIHRIRAPEPMLAITQPVDFAEALAQPRAANCDESLTLLWLPSNAASAQLEEEIQVWLGDSNEQEIVRAGIRTVRVAWTSDRCVIYASAEQFDDAMDAVLRFTLAKRQVNSLEHRMIDVWSDLDRDVPLSHGGFWRRTRRRRIAERTERVTRMNAEFLRLQSMLEQLDVKLTNGSKRLYAELVLQATIYDRLEVMEEPIGFVMNHYELANTRLLDSRNVRIDGWLEGLIVILLAGQILLQITGHG